MRMKHYRFDRVIARKDTASVKFDHDKDPDCIPMWIADMDFPVADEIVLAAKKRAKHPIFGYSYIPDGLYEAFITWQKTRHGVLYAKENIIPYYSVVAAIDLLLQIFTNQGDYITIMSPVYMCFWSSIRETKRNVAVSPLINENGRYLIDFASLEECLKNSKVLLLCSPHNPSGRVWTSVELKRINALAKKYHVLVISDEIHSDLIMPGFKHIPFITLDKETASYTITLLSATKTFNIAQSGMSFIISENQGYLKKIREAMTSFHLGSQNVFATVMVEAAFRDGSTWLDQVIPYINDNYLHIKQTLETKMPKIKILPLEGTYLAWLDCRALKKSVVDLFENDAHILGEDGILFGSEGAGYYRLNIATQRKTIDKMLERLETAYQKCTIAN